MRSLSTLILIGAVICNATAQSAKFRVIAQGQELGTSSYSHRILPDGTLVTKFALSVGPSGQIKMAIEERTKADGFPLFSSMTQSSSTESEQSSIQYGKNGITVKTVINGKSASKTYSYPTKGSVRSPASFWFIKGKPKVGETETSMSFSTRSNKWEAITEKYVGTKNIIVKGKTVRAHLQRSSEADLYLDDKGVPYRIILKQDGIELTLERT